MKRIKKEQWKYEAVNNFGDLYRVVPVGSGWGIALWNAKYGVWMGDPEQEFASRNAAIKQAKYRAGVA
jgi:hypothetical protein